ncbi:MAG: inositol monophosphatase [Deltaproteobacteria bacterium RBG_16_44_11]|nr:MAG: inositol monophosphatase [Deltaproteobacteria bacterium RBG_16_44_11]
MLPFKNFAEQIARKAGVLLKEKLSQKHEIYYKDEINLVTEADKMSEDLIITAISRNYPGHGILSEESPVIAGAEKLRWIIDPLDGTTNYAHGYPVFCVSIALEDNGVVILGVIYDPMRDEMFTAARGEGTYLNGKKLNTSSTADISHSLLATGFPYDIRKSKENNLDYFISMAKKAQAIRRAGAAALDLAYVAAGRFDGFWELKLMPWDTAAGILMVGESGGTISDISGRDWRLSSPDVVATNGLIHKQMIKVLKDRAKE